MLDSVLQATLFLASVSTLASDLNQADQDVGLKV